jgi:hypothetical protein
VQRLYAGWSACFCIAFAALAAILLLSACTSVAPESGILEGHVSIGPLTPVQQEGVPTPTPWPGLYSGRSIVIFDLHAEKEIARAAIDAQGNYRITLPIGLYIVDINHVGIDMGVDLPALVVIDPHQTTKLDIEIDTGIR